MKRHNRISRRRFLERTALAGAAVGAPALAQTRSPNEKLNIGVIGVNGRGRDNLDGVAGENVVALCDVDANALAAAAKRFPKARTFADFRKMLEAVQQQIDAVVVSTPDHTHAVAGLTAMRMGKHCYCEKPLAHSVEEVRLMTRLAVEKRLATQMGTQIHAEANYRRVVELVRAGAIGRIGEVHAWLGADFNGPPQPTAMDQPDPPKDTPPVPKTLDWDLWLGPAPYRPYHPAYAPFHWRYWWTFGTGQLGDFFCHYCDLAFWALDLRYPDTVEARGPVHPESAARWTIARLEFPARGKQPPVVLNWYHGGGYPAWARQRGVPPWGSAVLLVGSDGMLIADYGRHELLPKDRFAAFKRPQPTIPNSIGHHAEWITACKRGTPTTCNFDYSGPLAEAALLSNVALRTGRKLRWDAAALKAIDCPEADRYLRLTYRRGWELT